VYVPLIRKQSYPILSSFTQPVTTNNINTLTSLTVYSSPYCVMGIDFGFSDGTKVSTGASSYDGQRGDQTLLDLTNRQMFEVANYCGQISDFIRFCSRANNNNATKTCVDNGNLNVVPNTFVCMNNLNINSYVGNYLDYYGTSCISNLGVNVVSTTGVIDTSCLVERVFVSLIRNQTNVTVESSFTQPFTTDNINKLTSLIVYYSRNCTMGIDFTYTDGTRVSTGSSTYGGQRSGQSVLDLTNKRMFEVDSNCGTKTDFIRFCSLTHNSTKACVNNVGSQVNTPNMFVCLNNMNIDSYVGTYVITMGLYCLSNLGVNVVTSSGVDTTC
jgi:hypothetical protein